MSTARVVGWEKEGLVALQAVCSRYVVETREGLEGEMGGRACARDCKPGQGGRTDGAAEREITCGAPAWKGEVTARVAASADDGDGEECV